MKPQLIPCLLALLALLGCKRELDCTNPDLLGSGAVACSANAACDPISQRCKRTCSVDSECPQESLTPGMIRCIEGFCTDCSDGADGGGAARCSCSQHSQCASQLCDVYGDRFSAAEVLAPAELGTTGRYGRCVAAAEIAYVKPDGCTQSPPALGSPQRPYCTVADALAATGTGPRYIRLLPSAVAYRLPTDRWPADTALHLYGDDTLVRDALRTPTPAVRVSGGVDIRPTASIRVVLDGLYIDGAGPSGGAVCCGDCAASTTPTATQQLTVRRSHLTGAAIGLSVAASCTLASFDSSLVHDNTTQGLRVDSADFSITNSVIGHNTLVGKSAVVLTQGGLFRNNTVVANLASGSTGGFVTGINCRNLTISSSILIGNTPYSNDQTFGCTVTESAVSNDAWDARAGYALSRDSAQHNSLCIDKLSSVKTRLQRTDAQVKSAAPWDLSGSVRPQGPAADIGALEAAAPTPPGS